MAEVALMPSLQCKAKINPAKLLIRPTSAFELAEKANKCFDMILHNKVTALDRQRRDSLSKIDREKENLLREMKQMRKVSSEGDNLSPINIKLPNRPLTNDNIVFGFGTTSAGKGVSASKSNQRQPQDKQGRKTEVSQERRTSTSSGYYQVIIRNKSFSRPKRSKSAANIKTNRKDDHKKGRRQSSMKGKRNVTKKVEFTLDSDSDDEDDSDEDRPETKAVRCRRENTYEKRTELSRLANVHRRYSIQMNSCPTINFEHKHKQWQEKERDLLRNSVSAICVAENEELNFDPSINLETKHRDWRGREKAARRSSMFGNGDQGQLDAEVTITVENDHKNLREKEGLQRRRENEGVPKRRENEGVARRHSAVAIRCQAQIPTVTFQDKPKQWRQKDSDLRTNSAVDIRSDYKLAWNLK